MQASSARSCGRCGGSMEGKRSDATYCSEACRKRAEKTRAYAGGARWGNPEAKRAATARWQEANREKVRAYQREWHRRTYRAKYQADPSRWINAAARRRAAYKASEVSRRDWDRVVSRHRGLCAYCGERPWEHRDHVVPLARGGRHSIGNLLPACQPCNNSKSAKLLVEWRAVSR